MKEVIIIDIHSFVDVITNSSSELFLCNTDKAIETVKEQLASMLDTYRTCTQNIEEYEQHDYLNFDNVFGNIYVYTEEAYKQDKKRKAELIKEYENDYSWGYEKKENIGKIIIESAGDNSIPYALWEIMEIAFDTYRYHLG